MKLSISNIGWKKEDDEEVYRMLNKLNYSAIEIAPTRIFPVNPYEKLQEAREWSEELKGNYGLKVSSMQSIIFGKTERLFGDETEREILKQYIKAGIDFAAVIGCNNLVFGSPKNRIIESEADYGVAVEFFRELGEYASNKNTILSIEPNPTLYGTNFINYTEDAFNIASEIGSDGFKVNVDFGTIIENNEDIRVLAENIELINHVHISEPNLVHILERSQHRELFSLLREVKYDKYVSIEMKQCELNKIKDTLSYVANL
ncbi:MAG: sugar phosphate isomerase/epimerase family protein [Clostridium sp.]|uniref:sugar phosphate isomerase/epimerase family protein n=1 Tax=Clostridium sp. TaxID=1506 RepID=UPI003069FF1D